MTEQIPLFSLISKSGPVAIVVLLILASLSIGMWAVIISKIINNKKKKSAFKKWFNDLKKTKNLTDLKNLHDQRPNTAFGHITKSAIVEIDAFSDHLTYESLDSRVSLVEETIERSLDREVQANDKSLSYLSMCSSVAPFLGLFGTVWGIMHSFLEIGDKGSANITVVAPGIAEALVTTIVGLSVAIPAASAFNHFVTFNKQSEGYMYDFGSEILSLFRRRCLKKLEQPHS